MPFTIDANAPKVTDENYDRRNPGAFDDVLEGAEQLVDAQYDNDTEAFFLTRAGQIIRRTGLGADRWYLVAPDDAYDLLEGHVEDEFFAELQALGVIESTRQSSLTK